MELTLGNHDVYFVTIGARTTSQGKLRPERFALSTNRGVSLERARKLYKLWLTQADGIWTLEGFREAKRVAKGE
jgi:hypothetical protein